MELKDQDTEALKTKFDKMKKLIQIVTVITIILFVFFIYDWFTNRDDGLSMYTTSIIPFSAFIAIYGGKLKKIKAELESRE